MCGIAGILHPDTERFAPIIRQMTDAIAHRGPDDEGLWRGDGIVLGHRRLSIIDLSDAAHQPFLVDGGRLALTFNGEIYNYLELRAQLLERGARLKGMSDTEVIPHLYDIEGEGFLDRLHGMFAFALWDAGTKTLRLARDRVGKKPLFYAEIPGGVAFASEIKALLLVPGIDRSVRPQGIHDYLSFGVVPGPDTIYAGIKRVPPGHVLTIGPGLAPRLACYWRLAFLPKLRIGEAEALEEILRLLKRAVALRLRSDVPVGAFLSGGIDSGLITALAAPELGRPLRTYCIGFDDEAFDERPLAAQVANRYGTDHSARLLHALEEDRLESIVGHYDEPFADPSALPSFAVARVAREGLKVVLNGDGGDELFAGYRHYVAARLSARLSAAPGLRPAAKAMTDLLPAPRNGRSAYQFAHRFLRVLGADSGSRYLVLTKDLFDEAEKRSLYGLDFGHQAPSLRLLEGLLPDESLGPVDRMTAFNMTRLLADTLLVKMDIATMAHGLEARSPFLDQDLIAFAARLPERLKMSGGQTKPLLRKLARRLLPPDVARAPKRGFEIPLQRWMTGPLEATLRARLSDGAGFAAAHFDRRGIASFLTREGWETKRWAQGAWALLCLEVWWTRERARLRIAA